MHTVEFYNEIDEKFPMEEELSSFVKACLCEIAPEFPVLLSVTVTDNESIRVVNRETRQIDKPTDVLSFPMLYFSEPEKLLSPLSDADYDPETQKVVLGDLLISFEKVKEQAEEYGHSLQRELCYLTLHGILHLFGYDHIVEEDKKLMRKREEEILSVCMR